MDHERLDELFERAIDLAPDELDALLADLSKQDPPLHAALREMLRIDAAAAHFLETPPQLVAERIAAESPLPRSFGVWRVLRSLGIGGMGEVWLAERGDGEFEQKVAVKQVAYPTPGLLQRFRQERQILAHLQHPCIARLIDGGVDDAGAPYLVMEYVDGVPITEYARRQALDVRATLRLFLLVCDAVQHAHENLVVHRDLKPSNILVTADGTPKLLDFGIAKVLATTDEAAPARTATRMLTPDYAAPEQFSGAPVTTATDVYALGVVLYELLARKRPMRARSADGTAPFEPAPPSVALDRTDSDAPSRRRALRGDLDRIVLAALAADPKRRYSSPAMLSADLRRWLDGLPISARGQTVGYRLRKFVARNRYAVGAAAAVVVVSVVAAIVSLHQAHLAREQAARAEAVRQFLVGVFRQANPDESKGQPITAHGLLDRGVAESRKIAGREPFLDADVNALLGELYIDINDFTRANELLAKLRDDTTLAALPVDVRARVLIEMSVIEDENHEFETAVAHARQSLALLSGPARGTAEAIAYARYNLAHSLIGIGDYVEAESMLRRALTSGATPDSAPGEGFAGEWEQWGVALGKLGRLPEAKAALDKSVALNTAIYGAKSQHVANVLNDLGNACEYDGDLSCAEAAYRRSLDTVREVLGPDHIDVVVYESNLLMMIERQGRLAEAMPQRLQLIERERRIASLPRSVLSNTILALGKDYIDLGRFSSAETTLREALQLVRSSQGSSSIRTAPILRNIGIVLSLQGRYDEAESTLRGAIAIEGAHDPPVAPPMNLLHADIGNVLRLRHRVADAIRELEAANQGYAKNVAGVDFRWAQALAQLGEARLDAGDAAAAEDAAAKALEMARKALPANNYQISTELFALGRAKLALGRAGEAEPLLREALALRSPLQPADDPRLLEVDVALVAALNALGRSNEANELSNRIAPLLGASASPYALDLRARLAERRG